MAIIISERKSVQHAITDPLDLHDAVELEAAVYAASKFAAHSRTFSVNMCSKIAEMIRGPATPVPVQLQLIPVLQYMHHDASVIVLKHLYYSFKVIFDRLFIYIYLFRLRRNGEESVRPAFTELSCPEFRLRHITHPHSNGWRNARRDSSA